jgi:putative transposase
LSFLKNECAYLNVFETVSAPRAGIGTWIRYYNGKRLHPSHGILTPDEAYDTNLLKLKAASSHETHAMNYFARKLVEKSGPPLEP